MFQPGANKIFIKALYTFFIFLAIFVTIPQITYGVDATNQEILNSSIPVVSVPTNTSASPDSKNSSDTSNTPSTGITTTPGAGGTYTLLAPIDTFFPGGTIDVKGAGLGGYLNGLYRAGIAVATGLALIMIVVGGLEYVSTDSIQGKSNGKERIKNALIGLLLALTSYIILQQINPNLLKSDLQVESTGSTGSVEKVNVEFTEGISIASGPILSQYPAVETFVNNSLQNAGIPTISPTGGGSTVGGGVLSSSGVALRILQSAKNNINLSTCLVITENGRKGCGYAFGKIMPGAGIKFKNLSDAEVLSTSNIHKVLKSDSRFYIVTADILINGALISPIKMNLALPGDIIISPTVGEITGHVGIVETVGATKIISNSSGSRSVQSNYDGKKWLQGYRDLQKLDTYIYRYR